MTSDLPDRIITPGPTVSKPSPSSSSTERITRFWIDLTKATICRRWRAMTLFFLLSASTALMVATVLAMQSWEATCVLIYTPLPVSERDRSLYNPPDIKTLATMVNSVENLEQIRKEFKIELPIKALDRNLTAVIPNGTKIMNLSFRWDNGPTTVRMLNRLSEIYIERVIQLRKEMLAGHITDFEASLEGSRLRLSEASEATRAFHEREHVIDFQNDLLTASREIILMEGAIEQQKRDVGERAIQLKGVNDYLDHVKSQQDKEVEIEKQFEAANESVADNRRRQDRLKELIDEERRVQEIQAQLYAKRHELERVQKLHARGAASNSELDTIRSEIEVLFARIRESEQIKKYQEELERIDKMVIPKGNKKNVGSPIIQQTLYHKLELELQLEGIRQRIESTEKDRQTKIRDVARLERLKGEYEGLQRRVEAHDLERRDLESRVAALRHLYDLKGGEFTVVTPGTPSEYAASSNKKLLLIEVGGLGIVGSLGLLFGLQARAHFRTCLAKANQLGLPILTHLGPDYNKEGAQILRGFVLRLRQVIPEYGSLVMFTTHTDAGNAAPIVEAIARCLALRDERVVLLDARFDLAPVQFSPTSVEPAEEGSGPDRANPGTKGRPGLGDYLAYDLDRLEEICYPALIGDGVDWIPLGRCDISAESLATHRMSELLEQLRTSYSMILLIGPSLTHNVDLQILSAMAQGICTVIDLPVSATPRARQTLTELRGLDAPLLGQIVLEPAI